MVAGSLEVHCDSFVELVERSLHDVLRDGHIGVGVGVPPRQPRLHGRHVLHRLGDLGGHKHDAVVQVLDGRVELHLPVIKCQLHLEDGQLEAVIVVKQTDK